MRNFTKIPVLLILLGLTFYSCQKEEIAQESKPVKDNYLTPIPEAVDEGEFDIIAKPESQTTSSLFKSEFKDGGMAMIAGQFLPTVVIGNQRWIALDFKGYLNDPSLTKTENTIYGNASDPNSTNFYSYKLAMTLNESPTIMNYNAPDGLVELSNWRIPSKRDVSNLGFMAGPGIEGDTKINNNLRLKTTGVIYHRYTTSPIDPEFVAPRVFSPDRAAFWNSEFIPGSGTGSGPYGTWQLTGGNGVDYIFLFQFQYMSPHAPIRLVQDIEPIQ